MTQAMRISVTNQSSGATGNTELKEFRLTRTAALKTGTCMPSFVLLELPGNIGFRD